MTINPVDIARDIINIGTTAGIKKDVLDLQASKLRILTDEVIQLRLKVSAFEIETRQLKTLAQNSQPVVGGFKEFAGVLWKRTATGFEAFPYCKECSHHPIMTGHPPFGLDPMLWICSQNHTAPFAGRPK
jgi:hypothetical protein